MNFVEPTRRLANDWYPGVIPGNLLVDETAYLDSSYSFIHYRSRLPVGLQVGRGASLCEGTVLHIGPQGRVSLGEFAIISGAWISCEAEIEIGSYALIAWNVVLMDTYPLSRDAAERREELKKVSMRQTRYFDAGPQPQPIHIGRNAWIGFESCILPGVTIGENSIVGARSVVAGDVPPNTVVAGNPARVVRRLA